MHPDAIAVGELNRLGHGEDPFQNRKCTCGEFLHSCPLWSEVWACWAPELREIGFPRFQALQGRFERLRSYPLLLKELRRPSEAFRAYQRISLKLHQAIAKVSGAELIVDTSKYAVRALALSGMDGLDVRMAHLIRDGRGVFWSLKKATRRIRKTMKRLRAQIWTWMTPLEWVVLNRFAEAVSRRVPHLQVQYEQFVASPETIMRQVGALVGLDMAEVGRDLRAGVPVEFGHMVGGNVLRLGGPVSLKMDEAWREQLPRLERTYFWLVAGGKARAYGYERTAGRREF